MSFRAAWSKPEVPIFLIEALREEFLRILVLRDITMHLEEVECKPGTLWNDLFIMHSASALKLFHFRFWIDGIRCYLRFFLTVFRPSADLLGSAHDL